MHALSMLREFLRDPGVASISPTSPSVVRRICDRLELSGRRVVVELGPGLGCFSRELLSRLSGDSSLLLIEANPEFASRLGEMGDSRLRVVHGSADHVKDVMRRAGEARADVVLSGIPFSHFSLRRTLTLLKDVRAILSDRGVFVAYQCSARLEKPLRRLFPRVSVERHLFHLPPLVVLEAAMLRS